MNKKNLAFLVLSLIIFLFVGGYFLYSKIIIPNNNPEVIYPLAGHILTTEEMNEFYSICNKYGGIKDEDRGSYFFGSNWPFINLFCASRLDREGSLKICDGLNILKPIEELDAFCKKINGKGICQNNYSFICYYVEPQDEVSFCLWNRPYENNGCSKIQEYNGKICKTNNDCGGFPCANNKCLIKRCVKDNDCENSICANYTASPHGYCTVGGDAK